MLSKVMQTFFRLLMPTTKLSIHDLCPLSFKVNAFSPHYPPPWACVCVCVCGCSSYMSDRFDTANTLQGSHLFLNIISSFLTNKRYSFYIIKSIKLSFIITSFGFISKKAFLTLLSNDSSILSSKYFTVSILGTYFLTHLKCILRIGSVES